MASKEELLKKNRAYNKTSNTSTKNTGTTNKVPSVSRNIASPRNGGYSQEALDRLSDGSYGARHKAEAQALKTTINQQRRKDRVAYDQNTENAWKKLNVSEDDEKTLRDLKQNFGSHASSVIKKNKKSDYWQNKYGKSIDEIYNAYDEHAKNRTYETAKKLPALGEVASIMPNVVSGITGTAEALTESVAPNSVLAKASKEANQIANDSKERLRSAVDEAKGEPGAIKNFARQTADMVLPTIGAGILGGKVGGALMAGGLAANRKLQELEDRGIDGRAKGLQALGYGALEGGANALTVGAFDKVPVNTIFGQALKNAGSGAAENFVSEGAEQILDKVAGGDQSEWATNKAIAMLNGMTEEEAEKYATIQAWKQIGTTTGMGALTGAGGTIGKKLWSKLLGDTEVPKVDGTNTEAELPKVEAETPKTEVEVPKVEAEPQNVTDVIYNNRTITPDIQTKMPDVDTTPVLNQAGKVESASPTPMETPNVTSDGKLNNVNSNVPTDGGDVANSILPNVENANLRQGLNLDGEPSVPRVTNVEPEIAPNSTVPTVNSDIGDGTYRLDDSSVNSTDMGERRAVTNSGLKKGYVTEEQIQNDPVIRNIVERSVQHDDDVTRKAAELYAEKGEQLERDIASGKLRLDNGLAVAESNVILQKLTNGMNTALDNGDMESYQQLKARHDAVLEKNAEAGTDIARSLRMYGYFDHTADGAQVKAKKLQNQAVEKWKSRDNITPQKTEKLATKIINSLNPNQKAKTPKAKLTGEELVKSITASVKKFYGIDIDGASANQIARWQEEGIPAYVIRDEIEHLKNHGTFYEMTDDVKEVLPSSKILDRIFKRMGDDTKPTSGEPKKVNTLEDDIYEISNSLKKEFGSVEEIFDDNSKKILASDVQAVRDRVISVDEAENHIRHFLETGEWYTIDESTPVKKDISNKLAGALSDIGNDTIKAKNKKIPALDYGTSHATNLNKVKNTLELEQSSAFANMTEDGYEFLATMLDEKRPRQQITDELMHWLEHGEFYPIDDTKPTAKVKDSQISKMLERILAPNDIKETYKPKTPKTHAEVVEGIRNSLDEEASGIGGMFSDEDIEQLANWKEDPNIPSDILFSEIEHKILHGEFFEITQDALEKPKQNAQFNSAMQKIFPGEEVEAKAKPTFEEIRTTIDNSLRDGEFASLSDKFTPDELDYIARRMEYGLSTKDLTTMLQTKLATGSVGLKDETLAQVRSLFDDASQYGLEDKRRVDLEDKAYRLIANDIYGDRTFFEQFEGWRFLSMLGNIKTHVRNTLGNVTQYFVTEAKDIIATAAEEQADKIASLGKGNGLSERYRARLDGNDRALVKASGNDAQTIYARLNGTGRYDNATRGIERARKAFNEKTPFGKFMNAVNDINSNLLDKEDYFFLKKKYQQSLARFLKANGANESIFNSTNKADIDLLEKGRNFAIEEAQKATFHEYSEFAEKLTNFSTGLRNSDNVGAKVGGYMIEGLIPFKKTPINILKQGIKYSPASLVKGVGEMLRTVVSKSKGSGKTFSASEVIDDFAAGLTGTGIMALGLFLGKQGLLTGGAEDDYNVDNAQTLQGEQNYALKIGNESYTLDWLAPSSMPLFVGVELSKAIDKISGSESLGFNDYFNLAMGIAEPINEMSMLQGINNTLESLAYGNIGDAAANLATSMATGYVSQGVPTIAGQIARSVDDTRRSTYTGQTGAANTALKGLIKAGNKIPALSNLNEPFVNANGMTEENVGGNFLGRLAYNMLSPGYYQSGNVTDTDRELNRLYEVTGDGKVYGNTLDGKVSMGNNNSIKMSRGQMTDAQQIYGQVRTELYDKVINTDWYNNLDDAERVKLLDNIKDFSKKLSERAVADRPLENSDMELYDMYINEGADALVERYRQKKEADALGLDFRTYQKKQEEYEGGAEQYAQDELDAVEYGYVQKDGDPNVDAYKKALDLAGGDVKLLEEANSMGLGTKATNTYISARSQIPSLTTNMYSNLYGEVDTDGNDGITQKEFKEYLNKNNSSEEEAMLLYQIFGGEWSKAPYVTKKGTWSFK